MANSSSSNDQNSSDEPSEVILITEEEQQPKSERQRMEEEHIATARWSQNLQHDLSCNILRLQALQQDHKQLSNNLGGCKIDVKDERMKLLQAREMQSLDNNEKQQEVIKDGLARQGEELEKMFPSIVEKWTLKESLWASKGRSGEKALQYFSQIRYMLSRIPDLDVKIRDREEGVVTRRESAVPGPLQPMLPPPPTTAAEAAAAQRPIQGRAEQSKEKGKASESATRKKSNV